MLVKTADAAYPPKLDSLPSDIYAVLGYVGGDTPHIWTVAEVNACINAGKHWWPIWTAPNSLVTAVTLNPADGFTAAHSMLNALSGYPVNDNTPVFLDIEASSYWANPANANSYLANWKAGMHAAGYSHAFGYLPWSTQKDWVAYWINIEPATLPSGIVGWQYGGDIQNSYDLSIFDLDLLGVVMTMPQPVLDQIKHIEALVMNINQATSAMWPAVGEMRGEDQAMYGNIAVQAAREAALLTAIQHISAGNPIDITAIRDAANAGATQALANFKPPVYAPVPPAS
jgi:hypothetical protein